MNSFSLIRTNPLLTGNIKIVIDTNQKIYLESFNSNKILRNEKYKHIELKDDEYYNEAVAFFFKGLESNTVFNPIDNNDEHISYTDFSFQYDDTYITGAIHVEDNSYDEEYEYFAPLYINNKIPTDFIILRTDDTGINQTEFDSKKFKFVKHFNISDSKLGIWLNDNFITDDFPKYPLNIKHNDELSKISGLDIEMGCWTEKTINLREFQSNNTPIFRTEEYISNLWKENNLLYPNILNLKFLFDDTPATQDELRKYTINRYTGFYLDSKVNYRNLSNYKCFNLNTTDLSIIENLSVYETKEIPYVENNMFLQERNGYIYSFDPIKNGWSDDKTYYVEYKGNYYQLARKTNVTENYNTENIIGTYLYIIISDTILTRTQDDIDNDIDNCDLSDDVKNVIKKRILINELGNDYESDTYMYTTYENRISVTAKKNYDSLTAYNIIESNIDKKIVFKRTYSTVIENNTEKCLFTIALDEQDNSFKIDDYDKYSLHLIKIDDKFHIIQKYSNDDNIILAGKYYINSDYGINIGETMLEYWKGGKDSEFYSKKDSDNLNMFPIYRCSFTDVKDFDFDRLDTTYSKYEYEKPYEIKETLEPKLFGKRFTPEEITVHKLKGEYARRVAITDYNNRPLFYRDNRNDYNPLTLNVYTDEDLYYKDKNGDWRLFTGTLDNVIWYKYDSNISSLNNEYYREESYIWQLLDENENIIGKINFLENSNTEIYEELTWGDDGKSEISDLKMPLQSLKSSNPNEVFDKNAIPVSSEYINSNELWEVRRNYLTDIWNKNQTICKWGMVGSIGKNDYPYRMTYNLELGVYNREPNRYTINNIPSRKEQNLDYFYRLGITNNTLYDNFSLHLSDTVFNIDEYVNNEYDYFEKLLNSEIENINGYNLYKKYSYFNQGNSFETPYTIFRGCKFQISDVKKVVYDADNNIDDYILSNNTDYSDYKFSIIFSKKQSLYNNNAGENNLKQGFDIYLNKKYKNCLVHLYIESDDDIIINNENIETCEIDLWYNDTLENENLDSEKWDNYAFKINNINIDIRPRNFTLSNIIDILSNYNFIGDSTTKTINFIVIDENGYNSYNYNNTPFILTFIEPDEILVDENGYSVVVNDYPNFKIYNSLDNRITRNDTSNDLEYNLKGELINSINDINSYNNYPISYSIIENNTKNVWMLDDNDPSIYRHSGYYMPIFKSINLFEPYSVNKEYGNWKFYDSVYNFGKIDEFIFSKCNDTTTILKLQTDNDKSIYPMVDEFGYDVASRNLFSSTWNDNYYYLSRLIDYSPNEKITTAGYTIHLDGVSEFLTISDHDKFNQFNYLSESANYKNSLSFNFKSLYETINIDNISKTGTRYKTETILLPINTDIMLYIKRSNIYNHTTPDITPAYTKVHVNLTVYNPYNDDELNIINDLSFSSDAISTYFNTSKYNNTWSQSNYNVSINGDDLSEEYLRYPVIFAKLTIVIDSNVSVNNYTVSDFEITFKPLKDAINTIGYISYRNLFNKSFNTNRFGYYLNNISSIEKETDYVEYGINNYEYYAEPELTIFAPLWKEYAGIENPKEGRLDFTPYDITNYPIPLNWKGEYYIQIINYLTNGKYGDKLANDIKFNSLYEYDPDIDNSFDYATLYHFLEYGSRPTIENNDYAEISAYRFGYQSILNNMITIPSGYSLFNNIISDDYYIIKTDTDYKIDILPKNIDPEYTTYCEDFISAYSYGSKLILERAYDNIIWYNNMPDDLHFKITYLGEYYVYKISVLYDNKIMLPKQLVETINNLMVGLPITVSYLNGSNTILSFKANSVKDNFTFELLSTKSFKHHGTKYHEPDIDTYSLFTKSEIISDRKIGYLNSLTIEFWFKSENWNREYETIIYKGVENNTNIWSNTFDDMSYSIGRDKNSDRLAFKTVHKDLSGKLYSNILLTVDDIEDNTWYHVACVIDGENAVKEIYINGDLNSTSKNFINNDPIPSERELVYEFLTNRSKFIQGEIYSNLANELNTALKIRDNVNDTNSEYWFNVITGRIEADYYDNLWQISNWGTTLSVAYNDFINKYYMSKHLLNSSTENKYDIIIGNSSSTNLNKYNWSGMIDELRIWNYARLSEDIRNNYQMILSTNEYDNPLKTLIAYYRFDQGQDSNTINDLMNDRLYKVFEKWNKKTYLKKNDIITKSEKVFYFGKTLYQDSFINITDEQDWDTSFADIIDINSIKKPLPKLPFKSNNKKIHRKYSKHIIKKREVKNIRVNTKKTIFSKSSNTYKFEKWWLFKKPLDIKIKLLQSSKVVVPIIGNSLFNIFNLTRKK